MKRPSVVVCLVVVLCMAASVCCADDGITLLTGNDGAYVPPTIYINENASEAYVQQVYNEAWDLYGRTSCYTGRQLKMKVLNYMRDKGAIGWAEYFN